MIPECIEILEGSTRLLVPKGHSHGGPGKRTGDVFFNSQMAFNRDVSVMLLSSLPYVVDVADAMTATGSRAVRIANEVPHTQVVANDLEEKSRWFIEANMALNSVKNCRANIQNLSCLLAEQSFDYVDLDPFGSPVPFLQAGIRGCRRNGILAITATDTAPLAGAHRAKCERRYQALPLRGPMCHESGLRILMGSVARELARFDRGMEPLLSFYADHYFRTYIRVKEGAVSADDTLSQLGFYSYDPGSLERGFSQTRDHQHVYGPAWGGRLHDLTLLRSMHSKGLADGRRVEKYLDLWRHELPSPLLYEVGELSSLLKVPSPRLEVLLDALRTHGMAEKSHITPTSFRTDLPLDLIKDLYIQASGRKSWY